MTGEFLLLPPDGYHCGTTFSVPQIAVGLKGTTGSFLGAHTKSSNLLVLLLELFRKQAPYH